MQTKSIWNKLSVWVAILVPVAWIASLDWLSDAIPYLPLVLGFFVAEGAALWWVAWLRKVKLGNLSTRRIIIAAVLPTIWVACIYLGSQLIGLSDLGGVGTTVLFAILEAVVLWPLAQHWKANTEAFWLALTVALASSVGLATGTLAMGDTKTVALAVSTLIASGLMLSLLAAKLADRQIRRAAGAAVQEWLRKAVGEPPAAYWMAILWVALALALLEALALTLSWLFDPNAAGWRLSTALLLAPTTGILFWFVTSSKATTKIRKAVIVGASCLLATGTFLALSTLYYDYENWLLNSALPLAILAAALHRFSTQGATVTRTRKVIVVCVSCLLAVGACVAPSQIPLLPGLFGAEVPWEADSVIRIAWSTTALVITLALALGARKALTIAWRTLIVGTLVGTLLIIVLAYPIYTLIATHFELDTAYTGLAHDWTVVAAGVLGALLLLLTGPAAVRWSPPPSWRTKLAVGAAAGGLAGACVLSALSTLAIFLLEETSSSMQIEAKIFNTFLIVTCGMWWMLVGGSAVVGGVSGWLTPTKPPQEGLSTSLSWPSFALVTVPSLAVLSLYNWGYTDYISQYTQSIFDVYGVTPRWHPQWAMVAGASLPWLVCAVIQTLFLHWLHHRSIDRPRWTAAVALFTGFTGSPWPWAALFFDSDLEYILQTIEVGPLPLVAAAITTALAFETLVAGWRLWKRVESDRPGLPRHFNQPNETTSGVVGGCLVAVMLGYGVLNYLVIINYGVDIGTRVALFLGSLIVLATLGASRGMVALGNIILAVVITQLISSPDFYLLAAGILPTAITLSVVRRRSIQRLAWPALVLPFAVSLASLVVPLIPHSSLLDTRVWWLIYGLVVCPAAGVALRALVIYTPDPARTRARLATMFGLCLLIGLFAYINQDQFVAEGGISRYDGKRWEVFTSENSQLGTRMNYQLFADIRGQLWAGSGSGAVSHRVGKEWQQPTLVGGYSYDAPAKGQFGRSTQFAEDAGGNLWIALGTTVGQYSPETGLQAVGRLRAEPDLTMSAGCAIGTAWVWDAETGEELTQLTGHTGDVNSVAYSPDGTRIVSGSDDGTARVWDAQTGQELTQLTGHTDWVLSVAYSPDGTRIVSGSDDGTARVWDAETGQELTRLTGHTGDVNSVAYSPDGTRIVSGSWDDTVRVWDAQTGQELTQLTGHTDWVLSVAYSPDGRWIVSGSDDGTARIWDTATGEEAAMLSATVPVIQDGEAWDTGPVVLATFSPDSQWVLTVSGDDTARVWNWSAATDEPQTTLFHPAEDLDSASFSPDGARVVTAGCITEEGYEWLRLGSSVRDIVPDDAGNLWLATAGSGLVRLGGRFPIDAEWEVFTATNGSLASNDVRVIHKGLDGTIWVGTVGGLSRFDGTVLKTVTLPGLEADAAVEAILDGPYDRLWVGTTRGVYAGDGQDWKPFEARTGWPRELGAEVLFGDGGGSLWAGTESGAWRYDGERWVQVIQNVHVTAFAQEPPGKEEPRIIWIGTQEGLFEYEVRTGDHYLHEQGAGLLADWVYDLHVDSDGVWVSTFSWQAVKRSEWWGVGAILLFIGSLFAYTYRGYRRAPWTRARQLGRQIITEPESLYPVTYTLLADAPNAPDVLGRLADSFSQAGDPAASKVAAALAALSVESEVRTTLDQSTAAFEADAGRAWAESLYQLHSMLVTALQARRAPEIADLELAVNPRREAGSFSLHTRRGSVDVLPSFLPQGTVEAWRALEQIGQALRKYQEVDTATDRLSYLAEALNAIEKAQPAIQAVGRPEGGAMAAIVERWRAAVSDEIEAVSGRAELQLELRTRQVRRAEQITLALHVQNSGRAAAENVVVTLLPSEGLEPTGTTEVTVARLPSERSAPVEFPVAPVAGEAARVVCRVTWDDRVATGNAIDFADRVRFYETAEAFQRIPNPYIVGHPVKSTEMFHGREDVFQFIADNLSGSVQDRTLVLHGQRRTGKTSILYQLLQGRLGEGFIPVLVDMQELALLVNSTGGFLGELAYQLARAARKAGVEVEEPIPDVFSVSPIRAFSRFLDELEDRLGDRRVVVMFDEFELIEDKITQGKLDADLLGYFRSLMQHRSRLIFIFTGTHRLEEMSQDYWSIFFNIALYRRVSFLSPDEAARLIREPVAGALDVDELAVEKMINLTNGHPYFIQLICWALVNHCNAQERSYATINDINQVLQEILTTGEAHFAYIWQQASSTERLALTGLAHTLRPGKMWARPAEILETLVAGGDKQTQRTDLVSALDRLVTQEVLEVAGDGALRYRFQIEVLRLWIETTKSVAALVERAGGA